MEKSKKEKKLSTNKIILPFLFVFCSIILEIANFLYLGLKGSNGNLLVIPTYFLFDIAIMIMIAAILFLIQNKHAICAVFCVLLFIQAAFGMINATMYEIFGEILSINLLKLGAEGMTAFSFELIDWGGVALNLSLYVIMVVGSILLIKLNKSTYSIKHFAAPIIAIAMFIFAQSLGTCLFQLQVYSLSQASAKENEIIDSDAYLWENFQFKMDAYKKFGFYGFYSKEIINLIDFKNLNEDDIKIYEKYIDEGRIEKNENAPLYNDNLIVILLESIDLFGIDPVYTPTLYKMYYEGENSITLKNFRARNRTNNSEGITLLGSMPKEKTIYDAYQAGYNFDYSLPRLFKMAGDDAITTFVHPNYASFYDRNITHSKDGLGFDRLVMYEDYNGQQKMDSFGDWILDEEFVSNVIDKFLPTEQRFLTYFSTLSTHGQYTTNRKYFENHYKIYDEKVDEYKAWLSEMGFVYPEDEHSQYILKNYKVGTIDLENTINLILDELEKRNLSQNTSILMFADHNAYYHDLCYSMRDIEKSDFANTDVFNIPAMIYSPKFAGEEGVVIDAFTNTYDLLPTICQLYGLEQNTNLFLGHSILSEAIKDSFFASHLGGMFTDKIFSQNIKDVYILDQSVTEDDINRFKDNAINYFTKQSILETIYKNGINGTKLSSRKTI